METELLPGPRSSVDLARYRADLVELRLSDEQERDLLETLWSIMSSFVEMGFSVDICGLLFEEFNDASVADSGRVRLLSSPSMETPSDGSEKERSE